jgi:hypothetical protein
MRRAAVVVGGRWWWWWWYWWVATTGGQPPPTSSPLKLTYSTAFADDGNGQQLWTISFGMAAEDSSG